MSDTGLSLTEGIVLRNGWPITGSEVSDPRLIFVF